MRTFNTTGVCVSERNYMVDTTTKIDQILSDLIEKGKYFTINRARQYGKTTTLYLLEQRLKTDYVVLSISFEAADDLFVSRASFVQGFSRKVRRELEYSNVSSDIIADWQKPVDPEMPFDDLEERITNLCQQVDKKVVLMIDEVDKSSDNQIFLSFLGLLRDKFLERQKGKAHTFYSVILAGVYDIKNLKLKIRPRDEQKYNSPWNIADDFLIDLSFGQKEIASMLAEYEADFHTGMDVDEVADNIYAYTSGYPYLVSRMCEKLHLLKEWNYEGIMQAVKRMVEEKNTLFDDMAKKLKEYPELRDMLYALLFNGKNVPFHMEEEITAVGVMFGFLCEADGQIAIANRIFEIWCYNLFLAEDARKNQMYDAGLSDRNQFVRGGVLDMELVLRKFMEYFTEIYASNTDRFIEDNGRRLFLLYLKPIINGTGNYYVEARTRSMGRTDVIVDYLGRQYIIEMKIWHGNEYNERGEQQLKGYLDDYRIRKGYMISFNFNKNKKAEMKEIHLGDKILIEVVV